MRPRELKRAEQIRESLQRYCCDVRELPGISADSAREAFIEQVIESCRRVDFVGRIASRQISSKRADPNNDMFDPIRAALLHKQADNRDEAYWLVFLFTHFGKHRISGWGLLRDVYGALGQGNVWTWERVSRNAGHFRDWLQSNQRNLKKSNSLRKFGNHRKYESLDARSANGTGAVVQSYVDWVAPPRTHDELIEEQARIVDNNPNKLFDQLFKSLCMVKRFGRTAKFDYLTMLGKVGLINIEPGIAYVKKATGPLAGAKLLFGINSNKSINPDKIESYVVELGQALGVGMQVMEDSLCNWQKSPNAFRAFRG